MFKMYSAALHAGNTPDFWDHNWESTQADARPENFTRICENNPLWPLFEAKVEKNRTFIDGGCGPGYWVKYYHDRGFPALGVDFAPRTIEKLKKIDDTLDVRIGDITRLPLRDGEIHVYYSGGVVEHFESGPQQALHEARRVIARDGWFLCSVPDVSLIRRNLLYRRAQKKDQLVAIGKHFIRRVEAPHKEPSPEGLEFFQYLFHKDEFTRMLNEAGFQVLDTFGFSLLWGLFEIPGVEAVYRNALQKARRFRQPSKKATAGASQESSSVPSVASAASANGVEPSRLRRHAIDLIQRISVREDTSTPFVGPALHFFKERASNMRMYVARPL